MLVGRGELLSATTPENEQIDMTSGSARQAPLMDRSKHVEVPCDLCGSSDNHLLFVKEGFRHVRCDSCDLVFVNPRLVDHLEQQTVSGTGTMGDEELTPRQKKRLWKEVQKLEIYRVRNRILEVGAGRGWFLRAAAAEGWDTWAVEVNRSAASVLEDLDLGTIVRHPAEEFIGPENSVDVVRLWDVIEHLRSPKQALTNVHRVLRPGGLIQVATTNFRSLSRMINGPEWVYLNGADHIILFEPKTIRALLEKTGFGNIRIRTKSFNLRRKLYYPEQELPVKYPLLKPFRKLIDETVRVTSYGHQMIVTAIRS